jgi:hypothetical protein
MADALKQTLINTNFVAGEQPDANKLTNAIGQLQGALEQVEEAIGDIYNQQSFLGRSGGRHEYDLSPLPLTGPNLAREVGPAGLLNPRHFGTDYRTLEVVFAASHSVSGDPPTRHGYNHYNRRQFVLPRAPIIAQTYPEDSTYSQTYSYLVGGAYWALSNPGAGYTDATVTGTGKVVTPVTNISNLAVTGDYHVSYDGVITLYDELDDDGINPPEAFKLTYKFTDQWDAYWGASPNVLPDFEQTTPLCTVALDVGTTYIVTLPMMNARRGTIDLTTFTGALRDLTWDNAAADIDPMDGTQLYLPRALTVNLVDGDEIPSGSIQLWDETAGKVLKGITFTYFTNSSVRASGAVLVPSTDRYRLVVPGTDIAGCLGHLRESFLQHDHTGRTIRGDGSYMGHRLHHEDLLGLVDEGGIIDTDEFPAFRESTLGMTRNPHPQYLHRLGYKYNDKLTDGGDSEANWNNALLGDLVLGDKDGGVGLVDDSWGLYFGSVLGPHIYFDQGDHQFVMSSGVGGAWDDCPYGGIKVGSSLTLGTSTAAAYPRITADMALNVTTHYTLMQSFESKDANRGSVRIYATTESTFGTAGGLVITTNAQFVALGWMRDTDASQATRMDILGQRVVISTFDAIGDADGLWTDAAWNSGVGGCVPLEVVGYPNTGVATLMMEDALLGVKNASSAGSNPAAGSVVVKDSLYAKNIPKAWAHVECGAGIPVIYDSFGFWNAAAPVIEDRPAYAGNNVVLSFTNDMASHYYAILVTGMAAGGYIFWGSPVIGAEETHIGFGAYEVSTHLGGAEDAGAAVVALDGSNIRVSVLVFGEQK